MPRLQLAGVTLTLAEEDRQLTLLSLALCALDRPGFDAALASIAAQLDGDEPGSGAWYFEEFKRINADRFRPAPLLPRDIVRG